MKATPGIPANPFGPRPQAKARAAGPRRFRAFYRRSDEELRQLGLARVSLPLFQPVLRIRRDELF